jgi:hypothetical protein
MDSEPAPALGLVAIPALVSRLALIAASRLACAAVEAAAAATGDSAAFCAADCAFAARARLTVAKRGPLSSAGELDVTLVLGVSQVAARSSGGVESAVGVRAEESVTCVAFSVCVAALNAFVSGVWGESDWPGEGAVAPSAVWGIVALTCSASVDPVAFDLPPGLGVTVDVRAIALGTDEGGVAGVGFTVPVAALPWIADGV